MQRGIVIECTYWIFKYNFLKNGINSRFFIGVQLQIIEKGAEKGQML